MKRMLTLLLAWAMVFSLCACGNRPEEEGTETKEKVFQAGFGRADMTPDFSLGLSGYDNAETRRSTGVKDHIYMTCVAMSDGEQTVLLITADLLGLNNALIERIRTPVYLGTGVPIENIFVGATHTHSAPDFSINDAQQTQFMQLFYDAANKCATAAMADMAPAKLQATTAEFPDMTFVRHYLMNDGTYFGSNFGSNKSGYKEHATEKDAQMVLLKLDREEKQDILLMNWQAHPARASQIGYNYISADFVGEVRSALELQTGMHFAYFTGASGNQNMDSLILSEKHGLSWSQYGQKLAEYAREALKELKDVEDTQIKVASVNYEAQIDHSWDYMIAEAFEIHNMWKADGWDAAAAKCKEYNLSSVYQSRAIRQRASKPATERMLVAAFRVGSVGFTSGTYEMFSDHSRYVKENSPFEVTFLITGNAGYIPSAAAYDYRSYEADTGMYARGVGEQLAQEYVRLLESLQ